jgi:hypothetical protein
VLKAAMGVALSAAIAATARAEPTHHIMIDGTFSEWASDTGDPIPGYYLSPYADPQLQIMPTVQNGNVTVAWASGATGLKLQRTPRLTNPDWQFVSGSDTTNLVSLRVGNDDAFFRLVEVH